MNRFIALLVAMAILATGIEMHFASTSGWPAGRAAVEAAICFQSPPLGAIAPARPEWCDHVAQPASDTHQEATNAWVDEFNHGESHKDLSTAYLHGEANGDGCDIIHFAHNNHWMVDIQGDSGQYPTMCAAWMRPDRTFKPDASGLVVIEFEVASPIAGTRNSNAIGDAWPEFTLSLDPQPGNLRHNGTYIYEAMEGYWTFGCRMQQAKHPICALYDNLTGGSGEPRRHYEINQNGGDVTDEFGGGDHAGTGDAIDQAWKGCTNVQDPDTLCRNKFRVELTATRIKIFVNGVRAYEAGLVNSELSNILAAPSGFYIYFGDFAYQITQDTVVRFHWDEIKINAHLLDADPTPCVPVANAGYKGSADTKLISYVSPGFTTSEQPLNVGRVVGGEFSRVGSGRPTVPVGDVVRIKDAALYGVTGVGFGVAEIQVVRPNAELGVAMVQNHHALGDLPASDSPSKLMSASGMAGLVGNLPVSAWHGRALPQPALTGAINSRPQTLFKSRAIDVDVTGHSSNGSALAVNVPCVTPTPVPTATPTPVPTATPTPALARPCRVYVRNLSNTGWTYSLARGSYQGQIVNGVCVR